MLDCSLSVLARKLRMVGRGSFGSVYAVLLDNGRTIAMKELLLQTP